MRTIFNPELAKIALYHLEKLGTDTGTEKQAFVPMQPGQQPAQPQGDPTQGQPQGDPTQAAAQGQPPADPAQGMPQQAPQGMAGVTPDDLRVLVREEMEAANEKPKKQSIDERVTALEGLTLRLMQYLGLLPKQETDPAAGLPQQEQQDPSAAGADQMAGLMTAGTTGQPSSQDMSNAGPEAGMGMGGMQDMSNMPGAATAANVKTGSERFSGLAAASARLRGKIN